MRLITDLRFALRSLLRVAGLAITVVVTLALAETHHRELDPRGVAERAQGANARPELRDFRHREVRVLGPDPAGARQRPFGDGQDREAGRSFGDNRRRFDPSVAYLSETEIIGNVVTSPHHLAATMVEGRVHRMTVLFARLAPGADIDAARAELRATHGGMIPGAVPSAAAAGLLIAAGILASLLPAAARASRVDVIQAVRAD